jgi:hypothetical protein
MDSENPAENKVTQNSERKPEIESKGSKPSIPSRTSPPELPPSHTQHKITCQTEKDWWDKHKRWAELFGVLLLAAYTVYTIGMYYANRDAANAAKSAAQTAHDTLQEIQKGGTDTHDLALAAKAQADATRAIAENAVASIKLQERAFALNRPSVVVQRIPTSIDTSGILRLEVVIVNASSITATNFVGQCEAFLNGERPAEGIRRLPAKPIDIGSGLTITLCAATLGKDVVEQVKKGVFQIFVHGTYNGPAGKYEYCTKEQYVSEMNGFADLGQCEALKPFPQ